MIIQNVFNRWDNGETEKMSPWDLEPIPEEGNAEYSELHHMGLLISKSLVSDQMFSLPV